jgi:hypothetical protein
MAFVAPRLSNEEGTKFKSSTFDISLVYQFKFSDVGIPGYSYT